MNAHTLHTWQSCKRKHGIETLYRYRRWHPIVLFSACMRRAIHELSNGLDVSKVSTAAVTRFFNAAKNPGLDTSEGTNTYKLAMDLCATMRTVLEHLSRTPLLVLRDIPAVPVLNTMWGFLSQQDDSGTLHRWHFVDSVSQRTIIKTLHSWEIISDIVIAEAPMVVHFVSIGETRDSRRVSPWCRAYKSPAIANTYKFQRKRGGALVGDWKPIWMSDNPDAKPSAWVDAMQADNACEPLVQHINVKEPERAHVRNFYRDLQYEYAAMQRAQYDNADPFSLPMSRPACDTPYTCPHQSVCFNTESSIITLETSGAYEKMPPKEAAPAVSVEQFVAGANGRKII